MLVLGLRHFCTASALVTAIALLASTGCTPGHNALVQSVLKIAERTKEPVHDFDPKFAYLRVTRGGHVGWMWRGSTESRPDGPVEVFYSGPGEILRLQNGRIVGAFGLPTEWRSVRVTQPSWAEVANAQKSVTIHRQRDVMPGYRSGMQDDLIVRVVPPPVQSALSVLDPNSLTWFEERFRTMPMGIANIAGDTAALPPARYAVDLRSGHEEVVYAEQCLAPDWCFTWQRWSSAMHKAQQARK